jgi:hypothetical protein
MATAWVVSAVVFVQVFNQADGDPLVLQSELQAELDAKYSDLLIEANLAIQSKNALITTLNDALLDGYVDARDIVVTSAKEAYWMSEPELMLGVRALTGGQVRVFFADQTALISVGQRVDFSFEECDCCLMLKSSSIGKAEFRYACSPEDRSSPTGNQGTLVQARLN